MTSSSFGKCFQEPFSSDTIHAKVQEDCLYLTASFMIYPISVWQVEDMVDVVIMIFSNCSPSLWPVDRGWRLNRTDKFSAVPLDKLLNFDTKFIIKTILIYSSLALSAFILLCNHQQHPSAGFSSSCKT